MPSILKLSRFLLGKIGVPSRKFAQNLPPPEQQKPTISRCTRVMYNWSGFNRYGLYSDDLFDHNSPIVIEALRRLPEDELDARNFRIMRAMNLDFLGIQLPREEWLTVEEDVKYRYLRKHMEEVLAEIQEIHESGDPNYTIDDYWPHNEPK